MADSTTVAAEAAPIPDPALITRAEKFTRERFVHEGEDAAVALAPGSGRRKALDAALAEIEAGKKVPSTKWRRRYALLLGLERVLSEDEPHLVDGTSLNPHQVDALSGTLVALLASAQRGDGDDEQAEIVAPVLAVDELVSEDSHEPDDSDEPQAEALEDEDDEDWGTVPDEEEDADDEVVPDEELEVDEELEAAFEDQLEPEPEEEAFEDPESAGTETDEDVDEAAVDDPNAYKRFWFEHATGAGKTVAAMGFVEASRTGGVLILTHRRNLVDQFIGELETRGYADRRSKPLLDGAGTDRTDGPVTVETYQWFVRNAGRISDAYTIVICDEAHTALGEKTSGAIRAWTGPIFIGMTATGALIARHVADLFPTQTSRFDLAQAARRGVIAPLRCVRIEPGVGVRSIAKVPLRKGDVDVEFDQELLAEMLDQLPFNMAAANLYKTRFNLVPGVVYAAGVRHAHNLADAFVNEGIKAMAVSGETPKRQLAEILAQYELGEIDVLINAQLLAEGWNSPRATVCMHLAPTASKRIYQQRVGRVTRRHPGKEAGVVVDFVHPATKSDDPVVTLHSLLDRDVYRGGAIVVGPVRRGRGRRVRVERRVIPVCADEDRRRDVFERELWRIAVEFLDYGEQVQWAALAGARVAPNGWRRARAMLHFDKAGELKRHFLLTAVERNKNPQLRLRALQEIAQGRDAEAMDRRSTSSATWPREEQREAVKALLQALAERRIGRRDQAGHWIWDLAELTRDVHEEYAAQRWPETKRLLGLLVNSSGAAHARNARTARQRVAQARPQAAGRDPCRRGRPHARGGRRRSRRAHAPCAQARRARPRAAAQLPQAAVIAQPPQAPRPRRGPERQRRPTGSSRPSGQNGRHGAGNGRAPDSGNGAGSPDRNGRRRGVSLSSLVSSPEPVTDERRHTDLAGVERATPPPSSVTSSLPSASTPAAMPVPPSQATGLPLRASRALQRSISALVRQRQRLLELAAAVLKGTARSRFGCGPSVPAIRPRSAGRSSVAHGDVDADADDHPVAVRRAARRGCRRPCDRSTSTSLGHLICASAPHAAAVATAARSVTSGGASREHERHQQRLARRRRPRRARGGLARRSARRRSPADPLGAPASASSRASSLVDAVSRRCSRGVPSVVIAR